jgi:hypothetical protein
VAGLDESGAPDVVGQRAAKLLDTRRERRVADHRVAPHALEQLLPGDQLTGARDERGQDGGRPRREADLAPASPQPARPGIEAMAVEGDLSQRNLTVLLGLVAAGLLPCQTGGFPMQSRLGLTVALIALAGLWAPSAMAQSGSVGTAGAGTLVVKSLVEKKVDKLPAGPLFWRVETFATLAQAQAAAGPMSLAAESNGKAWLFTLGPAGGSTSGGTKMVEVGPIPEVSATQYLLRINEASGPPGSITPIHSHPGSEAAYVLAGEESFRSPHGVKRIAAGHAEAGHGADVPMQASSTGSVDLRALIMFVVDATKPFSKPATMP